LYTYLLINLFSVAVPFLASFDRRLRFDREFRYLFPAIGLMMLFFLLWDMLFTHIGVWGFNPRYLTGIQVVNLPIEEVLFFVCIPFASLFTYHALKYFFPSDPLKAWSYYISLVLVAVLALIAILALPRLYTSVTFFLTSAFIAYVGLYRREAFLSHFYFSYLFILIPFFIVNGILTGTGIPEEVVWYDNTQNLGLRLLSIPIEDSVYGMLMLIMTLFFMERLKKKRVD
jgi:lycopene cyclase domain-containing protein